MNSMKPIPPGIPTPEEARQLILQRRDPEVCSEVEKIKNHIVDHFTGSAVESYETSMRSEVLAAEVSRRFAVRGWDVKLIDHPAGKAWSIAEIKLPSGGCRD